MFLPLSANQFVNVQTLVCVDVELRSLAAIWCRRVRLRGLSFVHL